MPLRYPLSSFRRGSNHPENQPLITPFKRRRIKRRTWSVNELLFVIVFIVTITVFYAFMFEYDSRSGNSQESYVKLRDDRNRERAKDRGLVRRNFLREVQQIKERAPNPGAKISLADYLDEAKQNWTMFPSSEIFGADISARSRVDYLNKRCSSSIEEGASISNCVWSNEMNLRAAHISNTCESSGSLSGRLHQLPSSVDSNKLLVMKYRKLIWCPVFKAASTIWMKRLPQLSNFTPQQIQKLLRLKRKFAQPNEVASLVAKPLMFQNFKYFLNQTPRPVTFLIVRHPLERLLSAYRDKLERTNTHFFETYGRSMVNNFRFKGRKRFGNQFYDEEKGTPVQQSEGREETQPTFWEFSMSLIEDNVMDDHWRPMSTQCSLCQLEYDFVLKVENLKEEEAFMLRTLGLASLFDPAPQENEHDHILSREEKLSYFQMLNTTEMNLLMDVYQFDFELFEYERELPN